jgi:indolepyruvate ferredoxin oxidoreductase
MLTTVMPVLARMKSLRAGPLDLFGNTAERRMERALIRQYEADLDRVLSGLTGETLPLAVRIASLPQSIRGYGHVKDASVVLSDKERTKLLAQWSERSSVKA